MSLTVFPTIKFDTAAGSDTAASGAGPGTALTGTAAAVTNGSTSLAITDAVVDLSGVSQDGSAVAWIKTASGRQYSRINTISGSVGNWTVTLQDSVWTSGSGLTWAIGGKRATLNHADSRTLTTDIQSGWTVRLAGGQTQTLTGSALSFGNGLNSGNGWISFVWDDTSTRPIIVQSANAAVFSISSNSSYQYRFYGLVLKNSNATKTSAIGINSANSPLAVVVDNCLLGDATDQLLRGITLAATNPTLDVISSEIAHCTDSAIGWSGGSPPIYLYGSSLHDNAGKAVGSTGGGGAINLDAQKTLIYANGGPAAQGTANSSQSVRLTKCTIDGNTGSNIDLGSGSYNSIMIVGCNITGASGGYGITTSRSGGLDSQKTLIDYNIYGYSNDADGPANTSGDLNGITAGPHDQSGVSPGYTDRANGDFSIKAGGGARGAGYPPSTAPIGGVASGTTTFEDCGAAQHQDSGGGMGAFIGNG